MKLTTAWAKRERVPTGETPKTWLSLVDHSADVAAVFESILAVPLVARRLARLAEQEALSDAVKQRLCVHVALHDFGKANRGFQRQDGTNRGHVGPGLALLYSDTPLKERLFDVLSFEPMIGWGVFEAALRATAAHHGKPISQSSIEAGYSSLQSTHWAPDRDGYDPIAALGPLSAAIKAWFPAAFSPIPDELPIAPAFWHAYAGLVMLADWIGSDAQSFPLVTIDAAPTDRMARAREIAPAVLRDYGFDPLPKRIAMAPATFSSISSYPPRDIQSAVGEATGQIVVLEAETGSGKTEAALYRFARLFEAGEVDGLYFALPTRVAAKSIYARICRTVETLFPDQESRPGVVLAVPGYARVDGVIGRPLPGFEVQWDDSPSDAVQRSRWAAERPKRFLAGTIAVGTIDQALLGSIQVKHAHMRSGCLSRHLLVADEVHASDIYMERLLANLLHQHTCAGGHALLLSATLGIEARRRLLGIKRGLPDLAAAIDADYPAVSTDAASTPVRHATGGRTKAVALELDPSIADADHIARVALAAADRGAKVLVVRNLHSTAVATAEALMRAAPEHPALFRCNGVPTLHHGRFAREDRELLDGIIEEQMSSHRGQRGLILVGTQTLEQSLDICADFLITDLAPSDVLLQRIGRLHRHERNPRPTGFETPRAVVLSPADLTPLLGPRGGFGLGGTYGPYRDLVTLEATRRLIVDRPQWIIPEMNRFLVEMAMHPEARDALTAKLETVTQRWRRNRQDIVGQGYADATSAQSAAIRWQDSFETLAFADAQLGTRLGEQDLNIDLPAGTKGPFGRLINAISLPSFWRGSIDPALDLAARVVQAEDENLSVSIQNEMFHYNAFGLHRAGVRQSKA